MANYKCCKCDNTLTTMGMINAVILHDDNLNSEINLKVEESGKIHDDSLNAIFEFKPMKPFDQDFTAISNDLLSGSLGHFLLPRIDFVGKNKSKTGSVVQTVIICCKACNTCCQYTV